MQTVRTSPLWNNSLHHPILVNAGHSTGLTSSVGQKQMVPKAICIGKMPGSIVIMSSEHLTKTSPITNSLPSKSLVTWLGMEMQLATWFPDRMFLLQLLDRNRLPAGKHEQTAWTRFFRRLVLLLSASPLAAPAATITNLIQSQFVTTTHFLRYSKMLNLEAATQNSMNSILVVKLHSNFIKRSQSSGIGFAMLEHGKRTGLAMEKSISQSPQQTQSGLHS